ncbi:MAG: hypothetical protein HYY51_04340 [Candidatus Magasanikbacteria bacterium]|nr:hypothetical protein [Candidatus Magasanikbacteria bacterium]
MSFDKNRAGLSLGLLFGLTHLLWVLTVAAGWGQPFANRWHGMHFLNDLHVVGGFAFSVALWGVVGAFVSGYLFGFVFAAIYNAMGKK